MKTSLVLAYAAILEVEQAVTFEHNDTIFRIWWSDQGGWYMELLEQDDDLGWAEMDGGLCTGSARDAVEFMLPQ